jgi:RNA polymerase sigma-70 factor (ECF subfamily)
VRAEPDVVAELKKGNKEVYEALFTEHYKNMVLYAKKFVLDTDTARDISQDIFIYLWDKRKTLNIDRSVSSYLFRAVRNACINHLKRNSIKEDYITQFLLSLSQGDLSNRTVHDAHEQLVHNDLLRKIESTIESLPEQCKNIFRMSRFRGLKNKEIAEIYAVSPRTVETQIYRALKVLKEDLSSYLTSAATFLVIVHHIFYAL